MARDIPAGRAYVELFVKNSGLMRGLSQAKKRLESFASTASLVGGSMMAAGVGMATPIAMSLKTFASFEDAMAAVGSVSNASAPQLAELTDQAKFLGRTTSYTASQIAGLQTELGRAGFKPDEILSATTAIQNLGRATNTDLAKAAEIAGAALRQFSLPASDAVRVADVLTATANNSAQTVLDLGDAFTYVGPVATDAGMSLEDVSKALGVLANLGLKGSMGGTGLRRAVLAFADPEIQKQLRGMGVESLTAQKNLRPIADIMIDLGKATAKMPNAERLALFQKVFDLRGMTAGMKLSTSIDEIDKMAAAIEASGGAAERTAVKMDDTLGGTWRRFMSAVEGVQIAVGEALTPAFRAMDDSVTGVLGNVTKFIGQNQQLVYWIAGAAVGLIGAGAGLLGLGIAAKAAAIGIGIVQGALAFIPAIAAIFSPLMGPAGLMIIGLGAVTAAWLAWTESGQSASAKMGEAMDNQKAIFGETIDGIKTALANGDYGAAVDVLMAGLSASWSQGLADLLSMTGGFAKGVLEVFVGIASGVSEVWVNMQAGIAKKLLDWASQEGFVGEQMRAFLGVDPREKTAQGKMTQQQRAGLSEQVRVWESALGRVGASGTVESGEFAGTAKADLEQWISGALAKMQMENAGLTPEQLAVQGAADAQAEIDRQNAEQRAGIDATLGGTLSAFDQWTAAAQGRADAARSRLGEVTAEPEFDVDQAMNDWFDQREAEDAAIAEMTAAAGGGDVPVSLKGGGVSGTFSAAAAMAMGGGVGTPEAQTAGYTKAMLAELRKMIGRQDATLEELKKWGFIV